MKRRCAQPTIDLLLRENKTLSITLYVVAVLSVLCGIVMLGFGAWRNQSFIALAGAVETYLFIPAWRFVQELRRENRLIRLLEVRLNRARTASGAVDTVRNPFKKDTQQATTHPESGFPFFSIRGY
jgi:hypothetical protein